MKLRLNRSSERARRCASSCACARLEASTAASSEESSLTSSAPRAMAWPSLKRISATRPAISGRMVTASSARSVPTAPTSSSAGAARAVATFTCVAGGGPLGASFGACARAAPANNAKAKAIRMIRLRILLELGGQLRAFGADSLAGFRGVDDEAHVAAASHFLERVFYRVFEADAPLVHLDDARLDGHRDAVRRRAQMVDGDVRADRVFARIEVREQEIAAGVLHVAHHARRRVDHVLAPHEGDAALFVDEHLPGKRQAGGERRFHAADFTSSSRMASATSR